MPLTYSDICTLYAIKNTLDECITLPPTYKELVRKFDISKYKLRNGFPALFGITVYQYWLHSTMNYAKTQLENGAQVTEVAREVGYSNHQNFIRAYKAVHGTSPGTARGLHS